ncbi:ureidoglycolate dehydrogenase [Shouchella clausii]|uniref:ureidoglycolate dehydrogenase n=1 Tax=Shouchella clausii TaxID=79880 RepID=UPI00280B9AA9|nr:ureidoglycolate dehydrogenase [Shouchella clausii]WMM33695.1 ureidoglycolate dehydrogenase [Shouchella clausii]
MAIRIQTKQLQYAVANAFINANVNEEDAHIAADVLVHANLRGVDSHGVMRVEHYLKRIAAGGLKTDPQPAIKQITPSTAVYDADHGLGHPASKKAMDHAIQLAKNNGIGAVAVQNSSHCGALSYFVQQAAHSNVIGIAMSQTDKAVVPFGGKAPFFGTNPIAFGFPAEAEKPVILDFATSEAAFGKILNAQAGGNSIPPNWGVDKEGKTTTNPNEVAYLLPFGGAKGYGLAMVVEIFSALLTASAFGPHVTKMYGDYDQYRRLGHFFIAIDTEAFAPAVSFPTQIDQMVRELRQVPPADGFSQVLAPGDPEANTYETRQKEGIPLPKDVWTFIESQQSGAKSSQDS